MKAAPPICAACGDTYTPRRTRQRLCDACWTPRTQRRRLNARRRQRAIDVAGVVLTPRDLRELTR